MLQCRSTTHRLTAILSTRVLTQSEMALSFMAGCQYLGNNCRAQAFCPTVILSSSFSFSSVETMSPISLNVSLPHFLCSTSTDPQISFRGKTLRMHRKYSRNSAVLSSDRKMDARSPHPRKVFSTALTDHLMLILRPLKLNSLQLFGRVRPRNRVFLSFFFPMLGRAKFILISIATP